MILMRCPFPGCDQYGHANRYAGYCHRHSRYVHEFDTATPRKCVDCENWVVNIDDSGLCPNCQQGEKMTDNKVCRTPDLVAMCNWADKHKQNRRAVTELLFPRLDPNGVHLLAMLLPFHNGQSVDRVMVYAKVIDQTMPEEFILDIPHHMYEGLLTLEESGLA